jgi:ABC-2 type transport system ATP-binding protein
MTPTISVTGLTRRYRDQLALEDVTLHIEGASITGLWGRNGAGKSTLMDHAVLVALGLRLVAQAR